MIWRSSSLVFVGLAPASCSDDPSVIFFGDIPSGGDTTGDASADASSDAGDVAPDGDDTAGDVVPDGLAAGPDGADISPDSPDAADAGPDVTQDVEVDVPTEEICNSGEDEDGDGAVDCDDSDCRDAEECQGPENCGDGVLQAAEECDDANTEPGDGCDERCELESGFVNDCGDGVAVGVAGEECDDGAENSDVDPDACREDCTLATCGDEVTDSGEECDDGPTDVESTCTDECTVIESCGDGVVDEPEQCDDANADPGDGCHLCLLTGESSCGDGVYAPAFEDCDLDMGCADSQVCRMCECVDPVCGDEVLEGAEECESADDCGDGQRCDDCACVDAICGDGVLDVGEACDGSDDPCGGDGFCNDDCACEAYVCGDDVTNGLEECDGVDDGACTPGGACGEDCLCFEFECGNDIVEGDEECDGASDDECSVTEVCLPDCSCGPESVDPILNPLSGDLLAGADPVLVVEPWDAVYCDDPTEPHGFVVRLSGRSVAQITDATFQILDIDGTTRTVPAAVGAAGAFEVEVPLCLPVVPEAMRVRTTVVDRVGRASNAINWDFPVLGTPALETFVAYTGRDPDVHVFQISGSADDHNVAFLQIDLLEADDTPIIEDFDVGSRTPEFMGSDYYTSAAVSGTGGLGVRAYVGTIFSFGGEASEEVVATLSPTPGSGDECVPTMTVGRATCAETFVCSGSGHFGRCLAGSTTPPTLTSVTSGDLELGSDRCDPSFPNRLSWVANGSSINPIVEYTIQAADFGPDPIGLASVPFGPGAFGEEMGVCTSVEVSGRVTITLIHEGGRESAARSFTL